MLVCGDCPAMLRHGVVYAILW